MKEFNIVRNIINTEFCNSQKKFLYYGKLPDDTFNPEETVLPAVSLYFNLIDKDKVIPMVQEFGKQQFLSDWGVRILREDSPMFYPRGYHVGSV